jgi:hypothetical protein
LNKTRPLLRVRLSAGLYILCAGGLGAKDIRRTHHHLTIWSAFDAVKLLHMATWLAILDTINLKNGCCTGFGGVGFLVNAVIAENDLAITQSAYHFDV